MTAMSTLEPDLSSPVTPAKPPLRKRLLLTGSGLIALVVVGVYAVIGGAPGVFSKRLTMPTSVATSR
jgi:hypothetical protein